MITGDEKKCKYPYNGALVASDDILSLKPFASIIFTAWSMIFDMSICDIWVASVTMQRQKQRETHTNDMRCAGPGSEHREDPRAAPYIQHRLVFEEVWIVYDRSTIRTRAHRVLQHLLMNA